MHPGAGQPAQVLHRDDDEWPLALLGATSGRGLEIEVSALWAISDFCASNGATNVVVGSHGSHDPNDPVPAREQCEFAEMKAGGSVLFFTGSVWHGGAGAAAGEGAGDGEAGDGETGGAEAGCGEAAVGGKTRAPSAVLRLGDRASWSNTSPGGCTQNTISTLRCRQRPALRSKARRSVRCWDSMARGSSTQGCPGLSTRRTIRATLTGRMWISAPPRRRESSYRPLLGCPGCPGCPGCLGFIG